MNNEHTIKIGRPRVKKLTKTKREVTETKVIDTEIIQDIALSLIKEEYETESVEVERRTADTTFRHPHPQHPFIINNNMVTAEKVVIVLKDGTRIKIEKEVNERQGLL